MSYPNNMPYTDIDAMLHDVSNQMARSQLFRQLSAKSNSSSPGSRKGNPRVVKPHSSSGTPLGVQRRRTTAAYSTRSKSSVPQAIQPIPQAPRASAQRIRQNGLPSTTRPVTWHPGLTQLDNCPQEVPSNSSFPSYPIMASQDSYSTNLSDYSSNSNTGLPQNSELNGQNLFPSQYFYQPMTDNSFEAANGKTFCQPSSWDYSTHFPYQDASFPSAYDQNPSGLQTVDTCHVPSDYPDYSAQQTPNLLPACYMSDAPRYLQSPDPPQITKQPSKELVGMGLYDGPSRKELSTSDTSVERINQLLSAPQGKGLKLEETWQPPSEEVDDEDDEDEEDSSADEAEEVLPPAPVQSDVQPNYFQACGDLSSQSFFFDSDDPYTNCMSFNQGVQVIPSKAPASSFQNFMWI
ncbi:MAG: hypothetical protein Q9219_004254 [cf. Caloplaca sp. 3 TL-2023]